MKKILLIGIIGTLSLFNYGCKDDNSSACDNKVCYNNGTCIDGTCSCLQGYTGENCQFQITPTKMYINKIQISKFPSTDNGNYWDIGNDADIFPVIYLNGNKIWEASTYYQNAIATNTYDFDCNITILNPTSEYEIYLYDYDEGSNNDWMGGYAFTPYYSSMNKFPSEIFLYNSTSGIEFTLFVSYSW